MDGAFFQRLFDYNAWANRRVWDCIEQLTDDAFEQDLDYSIGSIRTQYLHTLYVEHWWFQYLLAGRPITPKPQDLPSRQRIEDMREQIEILSQTYLDRLTSAELQREVSAGFWTAGVETVRVWEALFQVANHSTDHRAQMLAMLHQLGAPTVAQDFLDYIAETQQETQHLCMFMIG